MSQHLVPCPECARHVRTTEASCPFCSSPLDLVASPAPVLPGKRLSRAALFAFGATLAASTQVACGDDTSTDTDAMGGKSTGGAVATGGKSTGGAAATTGGTSSAGGAEASGGSDAAGGAAGSIQALYGAIPAPLYGAVPAP